MSIRIHVRDVGLDVPAYTHEGSEEGGSWFSTLLSAATSGMKRQNRTLLDSLSFQLDDGDRLAVLGGNGAGKTTLLRVLAGSLSPTRGSVDIRGSRQALLNLGLGFNVEATVRENIFLRGTAMGMRPTQIRELVDPILEFAGLAPMAGHRLATLSSGQRMRLGFSVSTSVQHDIMLLDEWFGAGDFTFVEKARARMSGRVNGSRIVVLASHSLSMLRRICNKGIVLHHGKLLFFGEVEEAIAAYKSIYQSSEQYKTERQRVEREADRLVAAKLRELERERRILMNDELAKFQAERDRRLEALRVEKERFVNARRSVDEIRLRLLVSAEKAGTSAGTPLDTSGRNSE